MAYIITDACRPELKQKCIDACPVFCIYDVEDTLLPKGAYLTQVVINPLECIDCGVCMEVCEQDAVYPDVTLPPPLHRFAQTARAAFDGPPWA